jgi:hypothetical protein
MPIDGSWFYQLVYSLFFHDIPVGFGVFQGKNKLKKKKEKKEKKKRKKKEERKKGRKKERKKERNSTLTVVRCRGKT